MNLRQNAFLQAFFSVAALAAFVMLAPHKTHAAPLITFTIRPLAKLKNIENIEKYQNKLARPGYISSKTLRHINQQKPRVDGIFATYWGFITVSGLDGQVNFVRKHQAPELYLMITKKIEPVMMIDATVHHFKPANDSPTKLYHFERKRDAETQLYYWQTTQEMVDYDKPIDLKTVVLFANPKRVVVPEGITLSSYSPNLITPSVYVKRGIDKNLTALSILTLGHFFKPTTPLTKEAGSTHFMTMWQ